jgi:hypothetical protein
MYNGMQIFRGVVSYVDASSIYALVPALTGSEIPVRISDIIGLPDVQVGQQVVLAVEDDKAYNVHIIAFEPGDMVIDGGSA